MKKTLLLFFTLLITQLGISQIVNIPDVNFKNKLLSSTDAYPNNFARDLNGEFTTIDANSDGEIQISEAQNISYLAVFNSNISSIQGIEAFVNLRYLGITNNQITAIDISALVNLEELQASNNFISAVDFSFNLLLEDILMESNLLTYVDVTNQYNLDFVSFNYNQIEVLLFKTGSEPHVVFVQNPIKYICVDDTRIELYRNYLEDFVGCDDCFVNSYCSFTPGGDFSTVEGSVRMDLNANDCDENDPLYPNFKLTIDNGDMEDTLINDESGNYSIPLQEGNYVITPQLQQDLAYYTVEPSSVDISFPEDGDPYIQDFCVVPTGEYNDVDITLMPLEQARPGFLSAYKLIFSNKGTMPLSGTIDVSFNDDYLDFVSSTLAVDAQSTGSLSWNYSNLLPFENGEIEFTMELNPPTDPDFPLNGGDILTYTTVINPTNEDETPNDNTFDLNQEVVNSFDPNDITCLEGNSITEEKVGDYVHYLIRFENTGTANAVNIVVKTEVNTSKYQLSSIIPIDSSHDFYTRVRNGNELEFVFENIELPFDDANNDGYVLFKIKTMPNLVVGQNFSKNAEIYFDFNFPIVTNTATTDIVEDNLSVNEFNRDRFTVFPNPTESELNISVKTNILTIQILDMNGRELYAINNTNAVKNAMTVNVNSLSKGIYFLSIKGNTSAEVIKFVKN